MLNVLAVVLSCCGDGGTVAPGPWGPGGSGGGSGSCSSCTTATKLAANPTDCGANTYATTIDDHANLTCSTVSDTGLANAYSGVGSCSSHQFVTVETRNAAPTCSQPNYTDLAGCSPGAGGGSDMQYNNAGCIGGVANVISDATHEIYKAEALPSAPSSGSMAFDFAYGLMQSPMRLDNLMGVPMPTSLWRGGSLAQLGTAANWKLCVNYPSQWNSTSFDVADGCSTTIANVEGAGSSGGGWSTTFTGRIRKVGAQQASGNAWAGMHRGNLDDGEWTGNAAGVGGFIFWTRFIGTTHETGDGTFAGVAATAGAFTNGSRPGQQKNAAYVGCDATDSNLQVCSNDNTTTSCSDLGSSFPCRTNSTIYDVLIAYPPNGALPDAGTGFGYYVERLDSAASTSGSKSSNLPQNSVQMTPHVVFQSPDGGTLTVRLDISHVSTLSNW